jgi:uncharacterized protein
LPPESEAARICSFECTFCNDCVERLQNVCPNCAGGFQPRPIRPRQAWKGEASLGKYPASAQPKHREVDWTAHAALVARVGALAPAER